MTKSAKKKNDGKRGLHPATNLAASQYLKGVAGRVGTGYFYSKMLGVIKDRSAGESTYRHEKMQNSLKGLSSWFKPKPVFKSKLSDLNRPISNKTKKIFDSEIRRQAQALDVNLFSSDSGKRIYGTKSKGSSWKKVSLFGADPDLKNSKVGKFIDGFYNKRIGGKDSSGKGVPGQLWPGELTSVGGNKGRGHVMVSDAVRRTSPEVTLHELGHGKYTLGKQHKILKGIKTLGNYGRFVAPLAVASQPFVKSKSKAEKALTIAAVAGVVPLLVDEGHANLHAFKTMKKLVKKHKLNPRHILRTKKSLGAAYGTYVAAAGAVVGANYIAKALKRKPKNG